MTKEDIKDLFLTDDKYSKQIEESDEWIKEFAARPDEGKSKSGAEYMKNVIGIIQASEEVLGGNYTDEEHKPEEGDKLYNLSTFQDFLFGTRYKFALVNREVQKVVNSFIDFDSKPSVLDEVVDSFFYNESSGENQGEWMVRGFVPQYAIDLNMDVKQ